MRIASAALALQLFPPPQDQLEISQFAKFITKLVVLNT